MTTPITLETFLSTANADDNLALAEANAYSVADGKLIHRDTMNSLLADAGIYRALQLIAETDGHAAQDNIAAFLDSTEFNFIQGKTTGDRQIQALDDLAAAGITQTVGARNVDVSAALSTLRPTLIFLANEPYKPFAETTIADVKAIRHPAAWVSSIIEGGNDKLVASSYNKSKLEIEVTGNGTDVAPTLELLLEYSPDAGATWFGTTPIKIKNFSNQVNWTSEISLSSLRVLLRGERHIRAKYKERWAGEVSSAVVRVV